MVIDKDTFDFIEFEMRQAASALWSILSAFSLSDSLLMTRIGSSKISVIENLPSICSNFPFAEQANLQNLTLNFQQLTKR